MTTIIVNDSSSRPRGSIHPVDDDTSLQRSIQQKQYQHQSPQVNTASSVFGSTFARPALGSLLSTHTDIHLFLTKQPFESNGGPHADESSRIDISVVEVLTDQFGDRVGKWASFQCRNGIEDDKGGVSEDLI